MPPNNVTLRDESDDADDRAFMRELFGSLDSMQHLSTLGPAAEQMIDMQLDIREQQYRARFSDAAFQLILLDGRPVGRIVVDRTDGEWHLVDIAVLPANAGAVESEPRLLAICCRPLTRPDKWWEHQSSPAMSMPVDSGCDWASSLP